MLSECHTLNAGIAQQCFRFPPGVDVTESTGDMRMKRMVVIRVYKLYIGCYQS